MSAHRFTYLALHGFASSPRSRKNEHFVARFPLVPWVRPDLNQPSFAELSFAAMLAEVERAWEASGQRPLRIIGSSLGGYVAAWFASVHPERVDRLVLLCPAFGLSDRWADLVEPERMRAWRENGWLDFDDATGTPTPVHYAFFREGLEVPKAPRVSCPTMIVHGRRDETVPFVRSVQYARETPAVRTLVPVDDGHDLLASLDVIDGVIERFLLQDEERTMIEAKFCLRCGTALAAHQEEGRARPKCPGCGWIHYGNPTPVVAAIVEHRETEADEPRVVLVRNHGWPAKWLGVVTGFLEANETPEEGIVREVKEELGLDAKGPTLIGVYAFAQRNEVIVAYHLTAVGPIVLGAELELFKRVAIDKLQPWPFGTGHAVKDWLERRSAG